VSGIGPKPSVGLTLILLKGQAKTGRRLESPTSILRQAQDEVEMVFRNTISPFDLTLSLSKGEVKRTGVG
jgi:hypothetical protein